jgi:hypothetical protein
MLTETTFQDGTWEDALARVARSHPRAALVLAAGHADERFWIDVLERGAFDLVAKPFEAGELRRILENANAYARYNGTGERGSDPCSITLFRNPCKCGNHHSVPQIPSAETDPPPAQLGEPRRGYCSTASSPSR